MMAIWFNFGRLFQISFSLCWQQIEMSGSVTNELSAFFTPVVGDVGRLFLLV